METKSRTYNPPSNLKLLLFSLTGVTGTLMWMIQSKIQLYGQKVLGLSASLIALYITIFVVIDVINDPVIGFFLDRSSKLTKRWGKRFPFILIGMIGGSICIILPFLPIFEVKPEGGLVNPEYSLLSVIWIAFTISIWDTFQTIGQISTNSLAPDLIRDQKSRVKIRVFGSITSSIAMIIGSILIPVIIGAYGGVYSASAFFYMAIVMMIFFFIMISFLSYGIWEPIEVRECRTRLDKEKRSSSPLKEIIPRILKDRNWLAFIIISVAWAVGMRCVTIGLDFYVLDNLGLGIEASALPNVAYILAGIISLPLWFTIAKKYDPKKVFLISIILFSIGSFLIVFSTDLTSLVIFTAIWAFISGGMNIVSGVLSFQAIDNASIKSGKREEASYNGILTVFTATGKAWQVIIFAIISFFTGYNAKLGINNTAYAKFGLLIQLSIVPSILGLFSAIVFWKLYTINTEDAISNKQKLLELGL